MLGADGVATHEPFSVITAAAAGTVVAAPPAGFEVVVFSLLIQTGGGSFSFQNSVPVVLFQGLWLVGRPVYYHDPRGLFRCGNAQPLDWVNPPPDTIRFNGTFEIRPVGL